MTSKQTSQQRDSLFSSMCARDPNESHRVATPLELFFDLVFVVAVAQAAVALHHGIAEGHIREIIPIYIRLFFGIWWAWMNFTWFASAYDCDDVPYRLLVFVQMVGAVMFAAAAPDFVAGDFFRGVGAYVIMRLAMVAQWLRAARSDPDHRTTTLRYATGVALVQVGWVGFLFLPAEWQSGAFALLVLAELLVPVWAERAGNTTWHPHHIAERYGLFTIIVLGESVLSLTLAARSALDAGGLNGELLLIVAGGLLILFSMWWIYFEWSAENMLTSLRQAFLWGYGHYFVYAAAAAVGAGLAVAIDQATHHAEISAGTAAAAVAVPVSVFLGALLFIHGRIKPTVLIGALLVLATPLLGLSGIFAAGLVLAGIIAAAYLPSVQA